MVIWLYYYFYRILESPSNGIAGASTNGVISQSQNGIIVQDESMRTQYVPPEPRISILTRPRKPSPEESSSNGNDNSKAKSKAQQVKTLEQVKYILNRQFNKIRLSLSNMLLFLEGTRIR